MSHPCIPRALPLLLAVLFAAIASAQPAASPATQPAQQSEQWYQVLLSDEPAGWAHSVIATDGDTGQIESRTELELAMRRGPAEMRIAMDSSFIETADGKPVSARTVQRLGTMEMVQEMRFTDEGVEVVSTQGGQESRQTVRYPEDQPEWLTPAAAMRHAEAQMAAGAEEISFWTFDPTAGARPIQVKMVRRGEETVEVLGKTVPAVVWDQSTSVMPGAVMRSYVNDAGEPVKSTMTLLPGMTMTLILADEALARAKVNPPELLASTLLDSNKVIRQPRALRRAVYELTYNGDEGAGDEGNRLENIPSGTVQRVELDPARPTVARIEVDLDRPNADESDPDEAYLQSSSALNHQDPKVRELLAQALPEDAQPLEQAAKAERLRRFVHDYIDEKDLSVGFATASEVARIGQGDCTEHAVLLAALLRAAGIPSRTASGLVYVDEFLGRRGVFGYHMWTQAWLPGEAGDGEISGRWVDLDAVMDERAAFDATHITLGTSAMAGDAMVNDLVAMVPLLGRLSVEVVEVGE